MFTGTPFSRLPIPDFTNELTYNYTVYFAYTYVEFEVRYANLASASHSTHGDVKETLMNSDDQYAELFPGEQAILKFTAPQNTQEKRDFIIITEGHLHDHHISARANNENVQDTSVRQINAKTLFRTRQTSLDNPNECTREMS